MVHIAGLRGVLPIPSKLTEAVATAAGADVVKDLAAGTRVRDPGRSVYRYHQLFAEPGSGRTLVRKMIVCAVRLEAWTEGLIRPNEVTDPDRKASALAAVRATTLSPAAVLAGYRDAAGEAERLFRRVDSERPTLEVTTADHTVHRLWRVQSAELFGQLRHLFAPKKLTVLEGHDRYEAMLAYRDELATSASLTMYSSANYGLMCLTNFDDPALRVAPPVTLEQVHHTVELGATLPAGSTVFVPPLAAGLVSAIIDRDEDLV